MGLRKNIAMIVVATVVATTCMLAVPYKAQAVPTQDDLAAAQARIDELGNQLITYQGELDEAEAALVQTDNDIAATQLQIEQTREELAAARITLARRMRSGYKTGAVSFLDVLFSSTSLEDFANRIYYMDKVNEQDAETIGRINELEQQLEDEMATLEAQKVTQEQRLAEVEAKVGEYEALVGEAQEWHAALPRPRRPSRAPLPPSSTSRAAEREPVRATPRARPTTVIRRPSTIPAMTVIRRSRAAALRLPTPASAGPMCGADTTCPLAASTARVS